MAFDGSKPLKAIRFRGGSLTEMMKSSLASPKQRIQKYLSRVIESQEPRALKAAIWRMSST